MLSPTKIGGGDAVVAAVVEPIVGGKVATHCLEFSGAFDAVHRSRRRSV